MKYKYLFLILLLASILMIIGCSNGHHEITKPESKGLMPISMNLQPAYDFGYDVTRVSVTITKDEFTQTKNLVLTPPTAYGTFTDLLPGLYSITVSVYQDTLVIATGVGEGEVIPGNTSTVNITLHLVTGNLTVNIDWGTTIPPIPTRILFIGNSHTYYNGGVDVHVQALAQAAHPGWNVQTSQITVGGATLQDHLNTPTTVNAITEGNYDLVILQEQSSRPVDDPDLFYESVTGLDRIINLSGAQTGLYMTHGWQSRPTMIDSVAFSYTNIGAHLGALVCPAGLAWKHALNENPNIQLYDTDGLHPSPMGTYLSSCVIYASIWHTSPIGNTYVTGYHFSDAQVIFLQTMAWETVCSYFGWDTGL